MRYRWSGWLELLAFFIAKDVQNAHQQHNCAEAQKQQHEKQEDKSHELIFLSLKRTG
jgi:hypothetical protein